MALLNETAILKREFFQACQERDEARRERDGLRTEVERLRNESGLRLARMSYEADEHANVCVERDDVTAQLAADRAATEYAHSEGFTWPFEHSSALNPRKFPYRARAMLDVMGKATELCAYSPNAKFRGLAEAVSRLNAMQGDG